jgi:hypothetical protein
MHYLTVGSCLKNEESYIMDFIQYHRYVGVQKFVFFDREFNKLNDLLKDEIDVEIIHFPELPENNHQEGWGKLISYNKDKTKWLALIDADQVLVPVKTDNVCDILKDYENFASLQCNWKTFGSGGNTLRHKGSVYKRFKLTSEDDCIYNYHTQFICQPNRTLGIKTEEPHYPMLPDNEISVNTNKEEIKKDTICALNPNTPKSFNIPALHDVLWIAHYTNKSLEEWKIKNSKGRADIIGEKMPMDQFYEYDKLCNSKLETRVYELWSKAEK